MMRPLILVLLAIAMTGCAESNAFKQGLDDGRAAAVSPTEAAAATTNAPLPPTRAPAPTPNPDAPFRAKVGVSATYTDGWKVTVLKWEEQASGSLSTPKPGMRLVAVVVRYDNGTPKEASFNPFDWNLQDSAGVRHNLAIFAGDRSDSLNSGKLAPGGFVTGSVQFEVPIGDVKLEMLYAAGFSYKLATWELY